LAHDIGVWFTLNINHGKLWGGWRGVEIGKEVSSQIEDP